MKKTSYKNSDPFWSEHDYITVESASLELKLGVDVLKAMAHRGILGAEDRDGEIVLNRCDVERIGLALANARAMERLSMEAGEFEAENRAIEAENYKHNKINDKEK